MTFRLPHLVAALVLHIVLLTLLVGGVQCSAKPQRAPVISAVLLDPSRQETAQQKRRDEQRRQEERRKAEERKRLEAEQRKARELEQQRQAKADAARRKKEEDAKRQKQAAEQKKAEDLARRKKEQEEKRERDAEAERERDENLRMEQAIQEEATRRDLDREQQARAATEREAKLAQWADVLTRHIARNWVRPEAGAFECLVRVRLLPDGTVTSAKISKSCGNASLDKSVEDAVFRSSPLPKPSDPSVFDRDLTIRFVPES